MNVYDVVASLIGTAEADALRNLSMHPQKVRSRHVHRAELAAGELLATFIHNHFADPSFDQMLTELSKACRMSLIEWLRCGGRYAVVRAPSVASRRPCSS